MNRVLLFFSALLLLFCGAMFVWFASRGAEKPGTSVEVDSTYVAPEKKLTEFEFIDQLAQPFSSQQLKGRVWMASFFFASCPGICRQQNAEIAKIHRRFKDDDVTILNITVTPEQDSPHVLLLYANQFEADHEKWKFLTGKDLEYVKQVGQEFFSLAAADETHTSDLALFDRKGEMYGPYRVTDPKGRTELIVKVEELLDLTASDTTEESAKLNDGGGEAEAESGAADISTEEASL